MRLMPSLSLWMSLLWLLLDCVPRHLGLQLLPSPRSSPATKSVTCLLTTHSTHFSNSCQVTTPLHSPSASSLTTYSLCLIYLMIPHHSLYNGPASCLLTLHSPAASFTFTTYLLHDLSASCIFTSHHQNSLLAHLLLIF